MKLVSLASGLVFSAMMTLAIPVVAKADNLGDILRKSKWDRVIGTWVDADTKGTKLKTTYTWKFKDKVVEIATKEGNKETVALMGVNAKNGQVFHMGADNQGGSSLGTWSLENGDAILSVGFTDPQGQQGLVRIRHHLKDNNTLIVTIELPEPITIRLIRAKQ